MMGQCGAGSLCPSEQLIHIDTIWTSQSQIRSGNLFIVGLTIWMFPNIVVPQNGWFIRENPIEMDDLGVPLFSETPIWVLLLYNTSCFGRSLHQVGFLSSPSLDQQQRHHCQGQSLWAERQKGWPPKRQLGS